MQILIDISKDRYDEIMSMDWNNCRLFFDEEIRAIHDGKALEQEHILEKIETEIKALFKEPAYYIPNYDAYKKVLGIIDKYKAESEE